MNQLSLAVLALTLWPLSSCSKFEPLEILANTGSPGLECTTVEELVALPEEELDLGRAALIIQNDFAEGSDIENAISALDELARGYGRPVENDLRAEARRLLAYLHDECGFVYASNWRDSDSRLLAHVLETRQGNCVGLSTLYLAVAERVGLKLSGVLIPGHMYVVLSRGDQAVSLDPSTGELFEDFDEFSSENKSAGNWRPKNSSQRMAPRETLGFLLTEASRLALESSFEKDPFRLAQLGVECAPRSSLSHRALGIAYLQWGDREEALATFATALELDPRDSDARILRADVLHGIGEQDDALAEAHAAIELDPHHPGYHFLAARIHSSRFESEAMFEELDLALDCPWEKLHPHHIVKIMSSIGDPFEFEGSVWGTLAQKHKYAAKRLESIERGGKEIDTAEYRLHLACADLAGLITDTIAGFKVPASKLKTTVNSIPELAEHPRIIRYRAALKHAQDLATR